MLYYEYKNKRIDDEGLTDMKINIASIVTLAGCNIKTSVWDKVAGKERIYLAFENGKELGFIDMESRTFAHTGKAFSSPRAKAEFLSGIDALIETLEVEDDASAQVAPSAPVANHTAYGTPDDDRAYKAIRAGGGHHLNTLGYDYDEL